MNKKKRDDIQNRKLITPYETIPKNVVGKHVPSETLYLYPAGQ